MVDYNILDFVGYGLDRSDIPYDRIEAASVWLQTPGEPMCQLSGWVHCQDRLERQLCPLCRLGTSDQRRCRSLGCGWGVRCRDGRSPEGHWSSRTLWRWACRWHAPTLHTPIKRWVRFNGKGEEKYIMTRQNWVNTQKKIRWLVIHPPLSSLYVCLFGWCFISSEGMFVLAICEWCGGKHRAVVGGYRAWRVVGLVLLGAISPPPEFTTSVPPSQQDDNTRMVLFQLWQRLYHRAITCTFTHKTTWMKHTHVTLYTKRSEVDSNQMGPGYQNKIKH